MILVCDPSVDQFLHGEGSGSGESDSDFLLPSYHHHGKSPLPYLIKNSLSLIFPLPQQHNVSLPKFACLKVKLKQGSRDRHYFYLIVNLFKFWRVRRNCLNLE